MFWCLRWWLCGELCGELVCSVNMDAACSWGEKKLCAVELGQSPRGLVAW